MLRRPVEPAANFLHRESGSLVEISRERPSRRWTRLPGVAGIVSKRLT